MQGEPTYYVNYRLPKSRLINLLKLIYRSEIVH